MKFTNPQHESCRNIYQKRALTWYLASLLVLSFGSIMAARHYPGGFDWRYTVASALASQRHNPTGSAWFSSALSLSMLLLWPYVSTLKKRLCPYLSAVSEVTFAALRVGIACGALVGLERLLIRDLSAWIYQAHEILALITFLGLYFGILGLLLQVMLRQRIYVFAFILVVSPLLAIGITLFVLYLDQRGLGWLDFSWRVMGIPIWLSFAFWQWIAIGLLGIGLGMLSFVCIKENKTRTSHSPS